MTGEPYSAEEHELIATRYPDIETLLILLPHRTKVAIKSRAKKLGLAKPNPHWTLTEDRAVQRFYPDRLKLGRVLPKRSWNALRHRARHLGMSEKCRQWTDTRDSVLSQLAGQVSDRITAVIMGESRGSIVYRRKKLSLAGLSTSPRPAKVPVVEDIRSEARRRGITLGKITNALGCQKLTPSRTQKTISITSVVKVVEALGGELYVDWDD